jgi:hypothetical protein
MSHVHCREARFTIHARFGSRESMLLLDNVGEAQP